MLSQTGQRSPALLPPNYSSNSESESIPETDNPADADSHSLNVPSNDLLTSQGSQGQGSLLDNHRSSDDTLDPVS